MQRCRPWRRRSAPGSEAASVGCRLRAVGELGRGAERRCSAAANGVLCRENGRPSRGHLGDECAAARPYQQRQSDCDGGGDCDGADAVTDGRQQVAAVFWIAEGGVVGLGWLAGALRRGRIVPPTSTSTDPAPASPGIGERGPSPVYPSTSPSRWLALCLSIPPASLSLPARSLAVGCCCCCCYLYLSYLSVARALLGS
jgi:hypothetical protein